MSFTFKIKSQISKTLSKRKSNVKSNKTIKLAKYNKFNKIVHQWRRFMFDRNRDVCTKAGYKYKLWGNPDRTSKMFPKTLKYQNRCLAIGDEQGQSRYAQVADLARLEIVYSKGGVYLDSLFEINTSFLEEITRLSKTYHFIGANEDPCGLECTGYNGKKYLTNSFFAATQKNIILKRLLDPFKLASIDLDSQFINRTTGPYYLREGIKDSVAEKVFLFNTEQIYPFNVNATDYRSSHRNVCLYSDNDIEEEAVEEEVEPEIFKLNDFIKVKESPNQFLRKNCLEIIQKKYKSKSGNSPDKAPLVIYHSGLGGTWSW